MFVEHINVKFVEYLLDGIESPLANDETEAVPDVFVKLLLAFNVHFELPSDNLVMSAVASRGTAKTFTEKLMLLFNREGRFLLVSAAGPVKLHRVNHVMPRLPLSYRWLN